MKKRTVIISSVMLCLALIGMIVGVTAAWFGNVGVMSNTIIISSERPTGQAIINVDALMNSSLEPTFDVLTPAVVKPGYMQNPANITAWNSLKSTFNPLSDAFVDTDGGNPAKPLERKATSVTVMFPFAYIGAVDSEDNLKAVKITLSSATLINPKAEDAPAEQTDYLSEFSYEMRLIQASYGSDKTTFIPILDINGNTIADTVAFKQRENELDMLISPGVDYFFEIKLYFAKTDEECSLDLRSYAEKFTVYFSLGVEGVGRGEIDVTGAAK